MIRAAMDIRSFRITLNARISHPALVESRAGQVRLSAFPKETAYRVQASS
jgi:hypothetical protein